MPRRNIRLHEHDVIVIGAGGAGLRAAIEASARGRVGRARLQVAARQGPHRHGRGRHRRGARQRRRARQLEGPLRRHHARRAVRQQLAHGPASRPGSPGPRPRTRSLGRRLRPHPGRPHPPAELRRPQVPAARPRRRPHRPRADPHAAGPRHPPGHRRLHGVHGRPAPARTATASPGRSAYDRERGRFVVFQAKAVVLATGGIGKAYKITSNSWEYTGDGHTLAYDAGAELIDMEFVQFHPTGMVWPPSVRGILVTEGVRGEGGVLRNKQGRAVHVRRHPGQLQAADGEGRGGRLPLRPRRQERQPPAGTADARPRRPLHRPRGEGGPRQPARRRLPRTADLRRVVRQAAARASTPRSTGRRSCRACTTSSRNSAASTSPRSRWKSARRRTTSWAACASTATRRCRASPACSPAASAPPGINGANRLGGNSLSDLLVLGKRAGEFAAKYAKEQPRPAQIHDDQVEAAARWALEPFDRDRPTRTRSRSSTTCRT